EPAGQRRESILTAAVTGMGEFPSLCGQRFQYRSPQIGVVAQIGGGRWVSDRFLPFTGRLPFHKASVVHLVGAGRLDTGQVGGDQRRHVLGADLGLAVDRYRILSDFSSEGLLIETD